MSPGKASLGYGWQSGILAVKSTSAAQYSTEESNSHFTWQS
jgi:hypothetical protein